MQGQTTLVLALILYINLSPASGTSEIGSPVTSLKEVTSALLEVRRDNAELKNDNANLKRLLMEVQAALLRHSMTSCSRDNAATSESLRNASGGGATYIRWGRTSCPPESELVYKGYVGGGLNTNEGSATNHVCLPEDPQYTTSVRPTYQATLYGAEYQSWGLIWQNHDQDAPCALCRSPTRSSAVMIPARTSCYPGFHREYDGYLMAGHWVHKAGTEYICVDKDPENVPGGGSNHNGNMLLFTTGQCGSLKCPPYENGRVITCMVCSK